MLTTAVSLIQAPERSLGLMAKCRALNQRYLRWYAWLLVLQTCHQPAKTVLGLYCTLSKALYFRCNLNFGKFGAAG